MKLGIEVPNSFWTEPLLEVVYNCGLDIVEPEKADILVKPASEITKEELLTGRKYIALEKTDGANIAFRGILKHPSVIRYIKAYNYNSIDFHNLATVDGRLFTRYLSHDIQLKYPDEFIDDYEYNKIKVGWNFLHYFRLRELLSLDTDEIIEKDDERPIDVFFAGTVDYDNKQGLRRSADLITAHRRTCVEVLESIKDMEVFLIKGKYLSLDDYNQVICNSKIVVSPWGWGEPCYRDYEALLAGCILIKPLTSFITSSCEIFENSSCIWTKPDFTDLHIDLNKALKLFKIKRSERMNNREKLVNNINQLPLTISRILTV